MAVPKMLGVMLKKGRVAMDGESAEDALNAASSVCRIVAAYLRETEPSAWNTIQVLDEAADNLGAMSD